MGTLARRFIIVCLIFTIFALLLAAAVANASGPASKWTSGAIDLCLYHPALPCVVSR